YPFIARLPQRLLSHPGGGALAVVAPVNRLWTLFGQGAESPLWAAESTLRALLAGDTLGSAMEYFNQRFVELAVELSDFWADRLSALEISRERFAQVWRATQ